MKRLAAAGIGWGAERPPGTGQGIAFFEGFGSTIAQAMRVSVTADGQVRVHAVHCALDCGVAVNPSGIRAQLEGGVVESGYHDYGWLRIAEMPQVAVEIVDEGTRPCDEPSFAYMRPIEEHSADPEGPAELYKRPALVLTTGARLLHGRPCRLGSYSNT
jgi:CO/xanthine dehydrogenase Mo-binding subunit